MTSTLPATDRRFLIAFVEEEVLLAAAEAGERVDPSAINAEHVVAQKFSAQLLFDVRRTRRVIGPRPHIFPKEV